MSDNAAKEEYEQGLANIAQSIVEAVQQVGVPITSEDLSYIPTTRPGQTIPAFLQIKIAPRSAPLVWADFSQVQIEESSKRIARKDVKERLRAVVQEYQRWSDVRLRGSR